MPVHYFEVIQTKQGICWQLAMHMAGQCMLIFELTPLEPSCCLSVLISSSAVPLPACLTAVKPAPFPLRGLSTIKDKQFLSTHIMARPVTKGPCKNDLFLSSPLLGKPPPGTWSFALKLQCLGDFAVQV